MEAFLEGVNLADILLYGLIGLAYNLMAYVDKVMKEDGYEKWQKEKAWKTIAIGLIAGVIVGIQDPGTSPAAFEAYMAAAIPIADEFVNVAQRILKNPEEFFPSEQTETDIEVTEESSDFLDEPRP